MKKRERKKKENSTELQKPNVEAEVYNNNKKCDWGKKEKAQMLRFHSANKIDNRAGGGKGWKRKKIRKESTEQVKAYE